MSEPRLRILFASPVWAPSRAFGGPVVAAGELVRRLVARGNEVDVVTTTIVDLHSRPALRSSIGIVDGATVRYLSTPLRYRWMGITPTLPAALARLKRPDVVHVFGFRDPVTTGVAAWCRIARVPYVFEPLGMFEPRLRKVALKRALDATLYRGVARGAAAVVVASQREARTVVEAGVPAEKVRVRGNGFPEPFGSASNHDLRSRLGISREAKVILYVGQDRRRKRNRAAARRNARASRRASRDRRAGRPSRHVGARRAKRNGTRRPGQGPHAAGHGGAAARPLSAGRRLRPRLCRRELRDRRGGGGRGGDAGHRLRSLRHRRLFRDGEALVVPYEREAVVEAVRRVLSDEQLRERLGRGGVAAARRTSWDHVTDVQVEIYRDVAARTAVTKLSTDDS